MTFLAPAAAVLAVTIPAIVALYFLKIRRPTRIVPALHLWPNQIRDRQANVPWQRLRPSWLLFLQLLAAAVLVAAALQPALPAGAALVGPHPGGRPGAPWGRRAGLFVQRWDRATPARLVRCRTAVSGRVPPGRRVRRKCRPHFPDRPDQRANPGGVPACPEFRAAGPL